MNRYSDCKKNIVSALLLSSALAVTSIANAQDNDEGLLSSSIFDGWSGTASLGATSSTGNSEASNINGSIRLGKTVNRWEHLVYGTVFQGQSSIVIDLQDEFGDAIEDDAGQPIRRVVTGDASDRLAIGYQPKYYYTPKTYFFGLLDWEQDEPANIDDATRQIIGVGHRFYSNASGFLSGEAGFGNKTTDLVQGPSVNGGIGYLALNFLSRVNENVTFNADFRSDFGSDNTYIEVGLGVAFKISEKLAFKVSHFSRSNSDLTDAANAVVPTIDGVADGSAPSLGNSDSVTTFNLVIDI